MWSRRRLRALPKYPARDHRRPRGQHLPLARVRLAKQRANLFKQKPTRSGYVERFEAHSARQLGELRATGIARRTRSAQ